MRVFLLGLDFGSTNTVSVLRWPDGRVRPVLFDGSPLLPSAVFGAPGGLVVGRDAQHAARARPDCFEPHPKCRIDDGVVLLGATEYRTSDLVAAVLARVRAEADRIAEQPVRHAVLTYPAGWAEPRQRVLLAAARQVFRYPRLVPEPVAAACHFAAAGTGVPLGAPAMVYDLGAGTFDAAIVRRTLDGFDVLASGGLPDVGGLDVDAALIAHLGERYGRTHPELWRRLLRPATDADRRASRVLWDDTRTAKEMLSRASSALVHVPLVDEEFVLDREAFERVAGPLLARTVDTTRQTLADSGVATADLHGVFLVGGSSRIPLAATLLHRALGLAPSAIDQPELAVAEGAVRTEPHHPEPVSLELPVAVAPRSRRKRRALVAGGVAGLLLVAGTAYALTRPKTPAGTKTTLTSTQTPSPTPSPTPPGTRDCLVGTWQVESEQADWEINGVKMVMRGDTNTTQQFRADGTGVHVYTNRAENGVANSQRYKVVAHGTIEFTYRVDGKDLYTANPKVDGTVTLYIDDRRQSQIAMEVAAGGSQVSCSGDVLNFTSKQRSSQWRRVA
ncbi:Hsp70 family protein [Longispora sp. NPDC051575]|uniref:Hsp70 family protein n=1 Tax=Longispora sp. NPDC051575 TaxID=3154943 RepID=UPI00342F39D2